MSKTKIQSVESKISRLGKDWLKNYNLDYKLENENLILGIEIFLLFYIFLLYFKCGDEKFYEILRGKKCCFVSR